MKSHLLNRDVFSYLPETQAADNIFSCPSNRDMDEIQKPLYQSGMRR